MELSRTDPQTKNNSIFQLETIIAIGLASFLFLLPFHLVIKGMIPGPIGTYWKELLLGILIILWLLRCLISRKFLFSGSPIDWAVLIYLAFMVLRLILDRSGWVAAWGFYISIMYLPVFWLVPTALHLHSIIPAQKLEGEENVYQESIIEQWIIWLLVIMVAAGTIIAIGGILEFFLDIPLWPSSEILQRQGFADVFIYNTQIRRVYFTLDSPTALANTLAMLLPLALVLPFVLKQTWSRIFAVLASILIAACIVLTFSRGIWVAVLCGLIVMVVLGVFRKWNWKPVIIILGTVVIISIIWVIAVFSKQDDEFAGYRGVLELSSSEYLGLPLKNTSSSLLQVEPEFGTLIKQSWSISDPLTGQDDIREVLYQHPLENGKAEIIYRVDLPESSALRFSIALSPEVWTPDMGDGASFQIYILDTQSPENGEFIFVRYINPKMNPSDQRWRNYLIDLSPWAGKPVEIQLITEAGPNADWSFDWAGWSDLQIVTVDPEYLVSASNENAILRHTSSILDWARDETNRDRIVAWNLSLESWRNAIFWGNGLGTTGVAALRAQPETAIVTESQVLKGLVELGIPGFLLLAFLWFQIAMTSFLAYQRASNPKIQILLIGVIISLLIVFIEGLVYQNLEVKQVNAYFWTNVGVLAVLYRLADR